MTLIKKNRAFTLLEILLVVAAIGILAAITIVAINPTKQLGATKNAQRQADVNTILNAMYQYSIDHYGAVPSSVSTTDQEICATGTASTTCDQLGLLNLQALTDNEVYLFAIPIDPANTTISGTGYRLKKTASGRLTASAPLAELGTVISVTK